MVEMLRHLQAATEALRVPCFIIGAMARDIHLHHIHGLDVARPTRDIDFGIALQDWPQFLLLKQTLCGTGSFAEVRGVAHRLTYRAGPQADGIPVDLVPFGGIESPRGIVAWPPGHERMTVTGFDEANGSAQTVRLSDDGLDARVASIPGLALLKLFAWFDRGRENAKDAHDLLLLLRHYADAGHADHLYGEALPILEAVDYQLELAGATLLGRDMASCFARHTTGLIVDRLNDGRERDRLLTQLAAGVRWADVDDRLDAARSLLDAFYQGLQPG